MNPVLRYYCLFEDVPELKYSTESSACFDLSAYLKDNVFPIKTYSFANQEYRLQKHSDGELYIPPNDRCLVPTGIIFDIPEGYFIKLHVRSSVALKKGLVLANGTGIIDEDYVEPVYMIIHNISSVHVKITHGERLCQAELVPYSHAKFEKIQEKPEQKTSRNGGFGSTGTGVA